MQGTKNHFNLVSYSERFFLAGSGCGTGKQMSDILYIHVPADFRVKDGEGLECKSVTLNLYCLYKTIYSKISLFYIPSVISKYSLAKNGFFGRRRP